jgi:hypothetical protein
MRKAIAIGISLVFISSLNLFAQEKEKNRNDNRPKIEGSGNVITKDISVQSFDALSVSGVFSVSLTQGSKEQLKIEADDNLQDLFQVKSDGSTLTIEMKKDVEFKSKNKIKVYITFRNLKSMDLKMVGNLSSEGNLSFGDLKLDNRSVGSVEMAFTANKLDLDNKSVGNLKLSGKAENAVIKNNGVGSLKATDLVVQTMDIDNQGVGGAEVNAAKELKVRDSFLGKVRNVGAATAKKVNRVRV